MRPRSRWITAPLAFALASGLVLGPAAAAHAEDAVLTFDPPAEATVTYGDSWYLPFVADYRFANGQPVTGEVSGPFDGSIGTVPLYLERVGFIERARGFLSQPTDQPPTPAGNYQVYLTLRTDFFGTQLVATPSAPANLTIEPAPITITHKMVADPNNPVNAIVTASMTGTYIERAMFAVTATPEQLTPSVPRTPGGTWTLQIKDGDTIVLEQEFAQEAGSSPNLSFYWADVPLAAQLSSSVTFTPTGSSVGNFEVTQSPAFAFTAASEGRVVPVADPAGTDQSDVAPREGTSVPLGFVLLAGLLALGLVAAIITLSLRARSGGAAPGGEEAAADAAVNEPDPEPDPAAPETESDTQAELETGEVAR